MVSCCIFIILNVWLENYSRWGGAVSMSRAPRMHAATAFAAASLALFVVLNLTFVVNWGVCCADDAFMAVVAKNLAWGFGYSTSLSFGGPDFALVPFDAHITTGPTLVLPTSAAIRILGNRFWVPGAVQVTLCTMLLVAAWRALGPMATRGRAGTAAGVFILIAYAVSPYHFEHWYAMLGEVPAALAILLGLTVWAVHPASSRRSFIAAMLCSLAVLAKLLALIYAATFLMSAVAVGLPTNRDPKRFWNLLGPVILGFLLPIVAFEVWKAVSLGPEGYLSQVRSLGRLMFTYGTSRAAFSPGEITTRLITFSTRFGVSLPGLLILAAFGGSLAWRTGNAAFRRLYLVLLASVAVHACYWLLLSLGLPRYFFIGLILLSALVAIPYLALERPALIMLYSGALALGLLGTVGRLQGPISNLGGTWSAPSTFRSNQATVVRFLDARLDRRPFVGQWWAPVADLEYLSKGVLDFKGYSALTPADLSRGVLVVTNSRFDNAGDKHFSSFVASCGPPVVTAAPYSIHECGGPNARPATWARVTNAAEPIAPVVPTTAPPTDVQGSPPVATSGCNLEQVGDQPAGTSPVTLGRGDVLRLGGWIVNEQEHRVPTRPYVALQSINRATWYAPFAVGLPREDVARAKRHETYHASGFSVSIDTAALPPAEYRLVLLFRDSGPAFACDNGRRIVLR